MTDVRIRIEEAGDGFSCALTASGHAGYNPGCDIVCAGVSSITQALAGYLLNAGEHTERISEFSVESGSVALCCVGDEQVRAAYRMAGIGLKMIEKTYPNNVHVDAEEKTSARGTEMPVNTPARGA